MDSITFKNVSELLANKDKTKNFDALANGFNANSTPPVNKETKSIKDRSEETYLNIVQDVVDSSKEKLTIIHNEKLELRCKLIDFCLQILAIQIVFLFLFLILSKLIGLSDNVLSVYMTAVFVETLGAVIIMIKYAFKSDEEVKIIDILNAVVKNFQKYNNSDKT